MFFCLPFFSIFFQHSLSLVLFSPIILFLFQLYSEFRITSIKDFCFFFDRIFLQTPDNFTIRTIRGDKRRYNLLRRVVKPGCWIVGDIYI